MPRSRAATRLKIVEGAYELFYKQGFARVSMDAIAASGGVTKRTLYAHYDSKDALLADVLEHHSELALERIETWARKLDSDTDNAIEKLFSELALWSTRRRWSGAGFTRLVMELAGSARTSRTNHRQATQGRRRGAACVSLRIRVGRRGSHALVGGRSDVTAGARRPTLRGNRDGRREGAHSSTSSVIFAALQRSPLSHASSTSHASRRPHLTA